MTGEPTALVESLCEYLADSGNLDDLIVGTTLFGREFYGDTDFASMIQVHSEAPTRTVREQRSFICDIYTRALDAKTAEDENSRIYEFLLASDKYGITIGDYQNVLFQVGIGPQFFTIDEKERRVYRSTLTLAARKT